MLSVNSDARAINERGDVTGSLGIRVTSPPPGGVVEHGFIYRDGVMRDLGISGAAGTDINNSGAVCGFVSSGSDESSAGPFRELRQAGIDAVPRLRTGDPGIPGRPKHTRVIEACHVDRDELWVSRGVRDDG